MCLYVLNIPENLNPKIATEDIPCYKLLQIVPGARYYITPFQNFRINFDYENPYYMVVDEMTGHYYAESQVLYMGADLKWINGKCIQHVPEIKDTIRKVLDIRAGIHAYLNTNIFISCDQVLFKAIIPKGSHYFIGMNSEIVADKMIIFDESVK